MKQAMHPFVHKVIAVSFWALSLAVSTARAAGMSPDPSGIWYDPAQPGWGMSINQQGDTMFVALFVYDANHKPTWLVASNVVDAGVHLDPIGSQVFAGPLYRTSGPFFSSSTDTTALGVATVGMLQIARINASIALTYTVDGITVSKTVQPQTWSSDIANLLGTFAGGIFLDTPSACQAQLAIGPQFSTFTVTQGSSPDALQMTWGTGVDTLCVMTGTYAQQGRLASLVGPVKCGPVPNPIADVGTLTISEMAVGPYGFSGAATLQSGTCAHAGTVGGVKAASVAEERLPLWAILDYTGLWYDPAHPGWGMRIQRQGNTSFVVIFVYDANHQPEWFVASNVVDTGHVDLPPGVFCFDLAPGCPGELFASPLYRTSGPFLGSPADSTSLGVTPVGTLKLTESDIIPASTDSPIGLVGLKLEYSIDGQTVTKQVAPQIWSTVAPDLAGTYAGELLLSPLGNCSLLPAGAIPTSPTFTVNHDSTSTQIAWNYGSGNVCVVNGTYSQDGDPGFFDGPLRCGSLGTSGALIGDFSIGSMTIAHGFSGVARLSSPGRTCFYSGTIGGVKR